MVFENLLHDGKTDAAAAPRTVTGRIGAVETVENLRQILRRNSLSVVLNLHLHKISDITQTDVNDFMALIHVFDGIAYNVIDDTLDLLRIRDDDRVVLEIIKVCQIHMLRVKLQIQFFHTVIEIIRDMDFRERIRNAVRVNLGIKRQLIDQTVHLIRFVVNGADVAVHLLRRICHAVHDSLDITLDRGNRCFQVMRNVADQLFILFVELDLFLRRLFQPDTHLLEIFAEIVDLLHAARLHGKVKISVLDILRRLFQLLERPDDSAVNPEAEAQAREHQNQHNHNDEFFYHARNLRRNLICLGDNERTAFFSVRILIVHLFDHPLFLIAEINAALGIGSRIAVFRQLIFQILR